MYKNTSLLISIFTILVSSCGKSPCAGSVGLRVAFAGYSAAETDTVIFKKYPKGKDFSTIIDSVLVDTMLVRYVNRNDTLFPAALRGESLLRSQYDYQLEIPAINKTFRITDIVEENRKEKQSLFSSTAFCINPITSYTINGQVVAIAPFNEVVYLKR